MAKGIAITGTGIICTIGAGWNSVLDSLIKGKSGIGPIQYLESEHKDLPVGEVKMSNAELKAALGIHSDEDISRTSLLGAIALRQAMKQANLSPEELKGKRVAFISGTTVGGMDVTERHFSNMLDDCNEAKYVMGHDAGSNTAEIAAICGLDCQITTISTACSSALNAIILGTRMLLADEADVVIAGGTEALSRFHLNGFNSLMILDHDQCKPFDANRQGLNLGEGASYLVLERADDMCLRGASPLGYIAGYGNRCDAFHQTATSEHGTGAFLAMNDAMTFVLPEQIDYINAHGTGTPDNDRSESTAVKHLFRQNIPPMSSTKSYTGHTTSASGSIEAVICLMAMTCNFIPANLGWQHQDEQCITPNTETRPTEVNFVLCNSFGFGGNDSAIVLSREEVSLPEIKECHCTVASMVEVSEDEDFKELRQYVPAMESRRMSKIMKAAVLSTMKAIEKAGIDAPDAIVIATQFGNLEQGEKILDHISEMGEDGISPTLFMQSTHNTIAGALAIRLHCHGFNITYSHGDQSLSWALREAKRLISEKLAHSVLVGYYDQCPDKFRTIYANAVGQVPPALRAQSMIITYDPHVL